MIVDRSKEEIIKEIEQVVESKIKPAVAGHGGVIELQNFNEETGIATMLLSGACSGCASSTVTLKLGVENMLKHYIPEVKGVEGMDDPNFNDPYYTSWEHPWVDERREDGDGKD
jgi:Fe-S cluster biogenesis protein NfuA|tara:strand:- start:1286 stop:1627 length:342 start_codon:yes stop_codon:yes gene_type:complete